MVGQLLRSAPKLDAVMDLSLKLYLFYCSNSIEPVELTQGLKEHGYELKAIPLPCSGKLDILYLTKVFETGADGVAILTCKTGECHYLEGNLRAKKRAEAVDALLDEIGMGKGRTAVIQVGQGGVEQVVRELDSFCSRVGALTQRGAPAN